MIVSPVYNFNRNLVFQDNWRTNQYVGNVSVSQVFDTPINCNKTDAGKAVISPETV